MPVIVQYIVVRNGVHKMTFATKKEADAYDKMLDIAENMFNFLKSADLEVDAERLDDISFFLAQNKETAISVLKGIKPKAPPAEKTESPAPRPAKAKQTAPEPKMPAAAKISAPGAGRPVRKPVAKIKKTTARQ